MTQLTNIIDVTNATGIKAVIPSLNADDRRAAAEGAALRRMHHLRPARHRHYDLPLTINIQTRPVVSVDDLPADPFYNPRRFTALSR